MLLCKLRFYKQNIRHELTEYDENTICYISARSTHLNKCVTLTHIFWTLSLHIKIFFILK